MDKIKKLREMCKAVGADPWIEVDGAALAPHSSTTHMSASADHLGGTLRVENQLLLCNGILPRAAANQAST